MMDGVWRVVTLPARNCGTLENHVVVLSVCSVCSVVDIRLADPAENRSKIGAFSGNTGNLPPLRVFLADMLFVGLRFCGNEAILGDL